MPTTNTFSVTVKGNNAVLKTAPFVYGYKWSEDDTWGGDFAPIQGDTVYVPEGMVLVVDQSTPQLQLILVEGTIVFADGADLTVQAETILIVDGKFILGTELKPHLNGVTIILTGDVHTRQLPEFGNKVIGCYNCELDIHGKERTEVWSVLS